MTHAIKYDLANAFPAAPWLFLPAELGEVVGVLKAALGEGWVVERATDWEGETSIIAFPVTQDEGTPSFILFESDGHARLAMISSDKWEWDQGFTSFQETVTAFIAEAQAYSLTLH